MRKAERDKERQRERKRRITKRFRVDPDIEKIVERETRETYLTIFIANLSLRSSDRNLN